MNTQNHWIIIANAQQDNLAWMLDFISEQPIICCDGIYQPISNQPQWRQKNIKVVLGDFDSYQHDMSSARFMHTPDQNKTDLQKAIEYADQQHATAITILNALDNAMSHTLHNLRLLKRFYDANRTIEIIHPMHENHVPSLTQQYERIIYLQNESIQLHGKPKQMVSLFGFPVTTISSIGLAWDLSQTELNFSDQDSSRNRLTSTTATIDISGMALCITDTSITLQHT